MEHSNDVHFAVGWILTHNPWILWSSDKNVLDQQFWQKCDQQFLAHHLKVDKNVTNNF